jgi:uncharacterized cupredoxin-like copper-binding protein
MALVPLLAACGDDDSTTTSEPTAPAGDGPTLVVGAQDDLTFDEDAYEVDAGDVTFIYRNEGSVAHTLLIDGVDGFKLSVGREDKGSVELEPGTYELYCDVPGHEAAGMVAELIVT